MSPRRNNSLEEINVTPNAKILCVQDTFACNQSRHFLHCFRSADMCVLWSWALAVHCIHVDCSLPLKVKTRGYLSPNLWSRVTSVLSYRFNVAWHCNGSVPAPIKEHFVAEAKDYTWLRCHSFIAAKTDPKGFQGRDVYRSYTQTNKTCVKQTLLESVREKCGGGGGGGHSSLAVTWG